MNKAQTIGHRLLKIVFLFQFIIDELISAMEMATVLCLSPLSWIAHPLQTTLLAARQFQVSVTFHDFLMLSSVLNGTLTYFSWVLSRYERVNALVSNFEAVIQKKLEIMRSIRRDYCKELVSIPPIFNFDAYSELIEDPNILSKKKRPRSYLADYAFQCARAMFSMKDEGRSFSAEY